MASGVNKVILVGNLGRDPESRVTNSGTTVVNFSIAVNSTHKNPGGEWEEKTEWVPVVAFGKTAENCGKYLQKGRQVYIEGRMQTRTWEKDGQKKNKTEVIASLVNFLGGKQQNGEAPEPSTEPVGDDDNGDSIPF